jgi:AraC-like DNA-binding protein
MGPLPDLVIAMAGEPALTRLMRRCGLPLAIEDQPDTRIPLLDMIELFNEAAHATGDPGFGLRVGAAMRPEDFGTWVRYSASAATLGGGLSRLARTVAHHQYPGCLRLDFAGDAARFSYRPVAMRSPAARHHADQVLSPMIGFFRRYLGTGWRPLGIEVPYSRSPVAALLEDFFQTPVAFGYDGAGIVFDRLLLGAPAPESPDHRPPSFAELRRLAAGSPRETMRALAADVVGLRLLDGLVDIHGAAARLRVHPRTIQRMLAAEGTTYWALVDAARQDRACRMLRETPDRIADIAMDLGYDEPAHFTRAFRRWTGCSPQEFRAAHMSSPVP